MADARDAVRCVFADSPYAYLWDNGWVNITVACESGWRTDALGYYNGVHYHGLFQLSDGWVNSLQATYGRWDNAANNAQMAVVVLGAQGRGAWSCSPW